MPKRLTLYNKENRFGGLIAFLTAFGVMLIVLIPAMLQNNGYFIYYGDYNAQQIPFYHLAAEAVKNGGLDWSWNTDLGANFIGSYAFYLLGSPFFWLCALLPSRAVIYAMPVVLALKYGTAALTAYTYIGRFVKSRNAAVIGGLLYSFSGFQMFNMTFNHFHDVTALFPLLLIGMEELIVNNRRGIFALSTAIMALVNYFFFAGEAVFLVLYFIVRYFSKDFTVTPKKIMCLALEAITGVMLACILLIPAAMAVMSNQRLDIRLEGIDMLMYSSPVIPKIIQGFLMLPDMAARMNMFASEVTEFASISGYLPLFSMSGVIAFGIGRRKHWASRLTALCLIFACIPILNSIFYLFNGTYYARWFFMPVLIMALMTAHFLEEADIPHRAGLIISAAGISAFGVLALLPINTSESYMQADDLVFPTEFYTAVIFCLLSLGGAAVIFIMKKKGRAFLKPAAALTAAACAGCSIWTVYFPMLKAEEAELFIDTAIDAENDITIEASEDNFFRIDQSLDNVNYSMLWNLPSMDSFHSIIPSAAAEFYERLGESRTVLSDADTSLYALRQLFSVKYYLGSDGDELYGFEYAGEMNGIDLYENPSVLPMGFAYDSYISESTWEYCYLESRCNLLMRALVLSDEQIRKYSGILTSLTAEETEMTAEELSAETEERRASSCTSFSYDSDGFTAEYASDSPALVFFSVPYDEGWTARVNGNETEIERVQIGFMAVPVEAGESTIEFSYETPGLKAGALISICGVVLFAVYKAAGYFIKRKNKTAL